MGAGQERRAVKLAQRRLGMALHHVGAYGEAFEAWRLFPGLRRPKKGR